MPEASVKRFLWAFYNFLEWLWWKTHRWGGRHTQWSPIECDECGWYGPVRWCEHGYTDDGSGEDVTPEDYCPKCGVPI